MWCGSTTCEVTDDASAFVVAEKATQSSESTLCQTHASDPTLCEAGSSDPPADLHMSHGADSERIANNDNDISLTAVALRVLVGFKRTGEAKVTSFFLQPVPGRGSMAAGEK